MIYLILLAVLFVVINLYIALSTKISPIPYFPTQEDDMALIIKSLDLSKTDTLYDLGSGDGKILLRAAQKSNAKVVGIEIHPLLVFVTHVKKWLFAKGANIEIRWQSIFKTNIKDATVVYLYIGPFVMNRVINQLKTNTPKKLRRVVSYMYPFPTNPLPGFKLNVVNGKNKIYILKKEQ
jgi:hypothetical protein